MGYTLVEQRGLPALGAEGFVYRHDSGATVVHVKRDDDNKVFFAAFRTPPNDDTGVPHIVEHCVLSGSERYPAKDTFNELMKGSLHTFLNAMTYNDFTAYPIASRNDKDFMNLTRVYMDAVFRPLIYARETTFMREGWHLEPDGDKLIYNGIVFNEMKGAYSDPERLLAQKAITAMFPDCQIRFSAGGDPACIPDLTREQFLAFHREHYAPANSILYFYGDMDINPCLDLAAEWLDSFQDAGSPRLTAPQPPLSAPVFVNDHYSADDQATGNYVCAVYLVGTTHDTRAVFGADLLLRLLMKTEASPLKRALTEAGLGDEIGGDFDSSGRDTEFHIHIKNAKIDGKALQAAINKALRDILAKGLDADLIESVLNRYEFELKEEDFGRIPKGLVYGLEMITDWHHGNKDVFARLNAIGHVKAIREQGAAYFTSLIETYLLNNNHAAYVTLTPDHKLDERQRRAEADRLADIRKQMTDGQFADTADRAEKLTAYNDAPDSEDALATIPFLTRADVRREPEILLPEEGVGRLHTNLDGRGVSYVNFLFDAAAAGEPALGAYIYLLGKVSTARRPFDRLSNDIQRDLGQLVFSADVAPDGVGGFKPFLKIAAKALDGRVEQLFDLVAEILTESDFSDRARVKALLSEHRAKLASDFLTNGHQHAIWRAESRVFPAEAWRQQVAGVDFFRWLEKLLAHFDMEYDNLTARFETYRHTICARKNLTLATGFADECYPAFEEQALRFERRLPEGAHHAAAAPILPQHAHEAIITAAQVQYCADAADYRAGVPYAGKLAVLAGVLKDGYLMTELRIKGGAYGFGCEFRREGAFFRYSYRDPHLTRTFDVFDKAWLFATNFRASDREMTKYVLRAINTLDKPLTGAQKVDHATRLALAGVRADDLRRERDDILSATDQDMRTLAEPLAHLSVTRCVFGNEAKLKGAKELFDVVEKL